MAYTWTDIENGETGLSARTKINANGVHLSTISSKVDTLETSVNTLTTDAHKVGFADYNDSATAITPINVSSTYAYLTNNTNGTYTNTSHLPNGITQVWDGSTNKFDFSELSVGDMLEIRLDLSVTTVNTDTEITIVLEMQTDGTPYEIPFAFNNYKAAGTYNINRFNGLYIGSTETLTQGARFKIKSDNNCTCIVNGWYVKITAQ